MLGEFNQGEIVYQLVVLVSNKIMPGNMLQIKVRDDQGRATIPKETDASEFCQQYRLWPGQENVFVRAYKILAIEQEGNSFRIQALDARDKPLGSDFTVRKKEFLEVFLSEQQIAAC